VKCSCQNLIPFLPFFSVTFDCHLQNSTEFSSDYCSVLPATLSCSTPVLPEASYNHFARTPRKTPSSVVQNACLLVRYIAVDVLLLLSACVAEMFLPTRCLAVGIHVTIYFIITYVIFPFMPRAPKWQFSFRFSNQNFLYTHVCYIGSPYFSP
jgi:hypothetical protein